MPVFLHNPVAEPDDILRLLRERVRENLHLDYKATWSITDAHQQEEAGKDVAAFANTEGGDIVVGVEEGQPAVPAGFFTRQAPPSEAQVRAWLHNVIVPRDVVTSVRIRHFSVTDEAGEHPVLVVSVPAWSDGIVAVRTTKGGSKVRGRTMNDRISFLFPFRDQDEVRFREFDEVLTGLNVTSRRAYLRLREALGDSAAPPVHIVSLVREALGHGTTTIAGGAHAKLDRLDQDVLHLRMTCTKSAVMQAAALEHARGVMQVRSMNSGQPTTDYDVYAMAADIEVDHADVLGQELAGDLRGDEIVVIPLSQVEDAWLSAGVLNLLLKVNLLLTRSGWSVTTG